MGPSDDRAGMRNPHPPLPAKPVRCRKPIHPVAVAPRPGARLLVQPHRACAPGRHDHLLRPNGTGLRRRSWGGCAVCLTFAVILYGRALVTAGLAVKLALEAGREGALGGQVVLQARMRRADARLSPWSSSSRMRLAKASWRRV